MALQREEDLGVTVAIPKGVLIFQVGWCRHEGDSYSGEGTSLAHCSRWGPTFICSTWVGAAQPSAPQRSKIA